jgi:hypothetical protein
MYYFLFISCIAYFRSLLFRRFIFEKIPDYEGKTLSSIKREARQVILDHIHSLCSLFFSSIYIGLHALILYLSLILWDLGLFLVSYA